MREERQARNVPQTIDGKRTWDEENLGDEEDALGWAIDVERLAKKRKLQEEAAERGDEEGLLEKLKKRDAEDEEGEDEEDSEDEADSMLDSNSEGEDEDEDEDEDSFSDSDTATSKSKRKLQPSKRAASPTHSVATTAATNLDISPEFLKNKFPAVFDQKEMPKVLVTTSINSTLHKEAEILTTLFPNSNYIRRTAHAHAHKYSVREIGT